MTESSEIPVIPPLNRQRPEVPPSTISEERIQPEDLPLEKSDMPTNSQEAQELRQALEAIAQVRGDQGATAEAESPAHLPLKRKNILGSIFMTLKNIFHLLTLGIFR